MQVSRSHDTEKGDGLPLHGLETCLEQEDEDLIVLEEHSIIHNHGQGPGHFVMQPQRQKLDHIALAAGFATRAGSADGRMLMHQLHCN